MAEPGENKTRAAEVRSLLRDLAHELRDALSPVAASVDLLRLRKFEAEAARLVAERVDRGLRRAFATLDNFITAEQAENGTLVLAPSVVRLEQILQRAQELCAAETRVRCTFVAEAGEALALADLERTAQVVHAAAQRATAVLAPDAPVEIRATPGPPPQIHIRSRTQGQLVPEEEWFSGYRGSGGSVALRTARQIMLQQHGALEVATGSGAVEFIITLCQAGPQHGAESTRRRPNNGAIGGAAGTRLLIVDDSDEVRRAYREALLPLGYVVTEAADAEQALSRLEGDAPQVVLIDIHLPRINGYRLAQSIRTRAGAAMRLVMLSGMALDPTIRDLSREAGFDECLDKMAGPLALHELLQTALPG